MKAIILDCCAQISRIDVVKIDDISADEYHLIVRYFDDNSVDRVGVFALSDISYNSAIQLEYIHDVCQFDVKSYVQDLEKIQWDHIHVKRLDDIIMIQLIVTLKQQKAFDHIMRRHHVEPDKLKCFEYADMNMVVRRRNI